MQCGVFQDRQSKCVPGWRGYDCSEKIRTAELANMRYPVTIFNITGSSLGETYDMAKFSNTYTVWAGKIIPKKTRLF